MRVFHLFIATLVVGSLSSCKQDEVLPQENYQCESINSPQHPKAEKYHNLVKEIVASGVPGMMLTVHDQQNGYWSVAAGMADLASGVQLQPCNITRVGSTVKTLTAVSILLLQEEGLLAIDDPVSKFLSAEETAGLKNAESSTIRHLLQHSSGIYNYIQSLKFQTASLNDLEKVWLPDELLEYAREKDPYFSPGADTKYSNTNYILLGRIIEIVTGKPFYEFFNERIFEPYDLRYTQFAATNPVPQDIVRGYVDFYSNLEVINATFYSGWDYYTADGGLISNSHDLNVFMTTLFEGEMLATPSLTAMTSWKTSSEQDSDGFKTDYGLGIFRIETGYGPAYIHSGDAIGYFASMVYFPEQKVTITWAVNGNYGSLDQFSQSKEAMEKIFKTVLE